MNKKWTCLSLHFVLSDWTYGIIYQWYVTSISGIWPISNIYRPYICLPNKKYHLNEATTKVRNRMNKYSRIYEPLVTFGNFEKSWRLSNPCIECMGVWPYVLKSMVTSISYIKIRKLKLVVHKKPLSVLKHMANNFSLLTILFYHLCCNPVFLWMAPQVYGHVHTCNCK